MVDLAYRALDFFRILFGYDSCCPDSTTARGQQQFWCCIGSGVFLFDIFPTSKLSLRCFIYRFFYTDPILK